MRNAISGLLVLCLYFTGITGVYAKKKIKLIPKPEKSVFSGESIELSSGWKICVDIKDEDDAYAASLISKEVKDCFGWDWKTITEKPEKNFILIKKGAGDKKEPKLFREQGYLLNMEKDRIIIEAPSATGRFYGAQTLRQIFRNAEKHLIPVAEIKDYPSLEWRGLSDDISRGQVSMVHDFRNIIRQLAFYKVNLYQPYIEDMFRFETDPEIGKSRGAITKSEMAEMLFEAKRNHVILCPVFECLGHQDRLLSIPHNRKYSEITDPDKEPWSFSPVNEDAYQFVIKLIDEIAESTPSQFFHIGGDESWDVGKGSSKNAVQEKGKGRVHAEYFSRLHKHLKKKHGKQMMLYADMINRHPEALKYMPKDCIMVDWHYSKNADFSTVKKLKDAGFKNVVTSPGLWSWKNYYPNYSYGIKNMAKAADVAREEGLMGCITSSWGDRGAENLRENNWLGYAYSAAAGWEEKSPDADMFFRRFVSVHFGDDSDEFARALKYAGWYEDVDVAYLGTTFHRRMRIKPYKKEWIEKIGLFRERMKNLQSILEKHKKKFRFNKDYPDILSDVIKRHIYLTERDIAMDRIAGILEGKKSGDLSEAEQAVIIKDLENLREQLAQIAAEYPELWLRRYKYPLLGDNITRLYEQLGVIQEFIVKAKRGELYSNKEK
jgi:hexosaminidase